MPVQIQLRHDTAANWTSANPTLALGEVGVETNTGKLKVGDGATAWASLPYAPGGGAGGTPAVVLGTTAAAGTATTFLRDDDTIVAFDTTAPAGVAASAATGSAAVAARRDHAHSGLGAALALTGATAATRYVGATASGHPTSGTFAVGDYVVAQNGHVWVCTGAGTSGTWVDAGAGGGLADEGAFTYLDATDAAAPGNPSAGYHRLYSKSGGLYYRDSTGTEVGPLGSGGGGGGALVLLEQHTASSSATLDFTTCITSTYDEYLIEFHQVLPASGSNTFYMRCSTDGGSTYDSGSNYDAAFAYLYDNSGGSSGASGTAFLLGGTNVAAATMGFNGSLRFFDPLNASLSKGYTQHTFYYHDSLNKMIQQQGSGRYASSAAVNALRFYFGSGDIASGTIRVYGIAKV